MCLFQDGDQQPESTNISHASMAFHACFRLVAGALINTEPHARFGEDLRESSSWCVAIGYGRATLHVLRDPTNH